MQTLTRFLVTATETREVKSCVVAGSATEARKTFMKGLVARQTGKVLRTEHVEVTPESDANGAPIK